MIQYDTITDEYLRKLVINSVTIQSQPAEKIEVMVERISKLPQEGKIALIKTLEDEQQQIKIAQLAKGITPEQELETIALNKARIIKIKKDFEGEIRKDNLIQDKEDSDKMAEEILQSLN